jgi:anti-anti-sigma regulatory factor
VNAPMIEQRIRALLGGGNVVVDCRVVAFLDVAGLRMLARVGIAAVTAGTVLRLRCSPAMMEMLNVCGVRELPGLELDLDDHDGPGAWVDQLS